MLHPSPIPGSIDREADGQTSPLTVRTDRRDFLGATAAAMTAVFSGRLPAPAQEKEETERARRRTAIVDHLLHPPPKESWMYTRVCAGKITANKEMNYTLAKDVFAFIGPEEKPETSRLWRVLTPPPNDVLIEMCEHAGGVIYLAPRFLLPGNEERLRAAAARDKLPPLMPVWEADGDLSVSSGKIWVRPVAAAEKDRDSTDEFTKAARDRVLAVAKEHGLRYVPEKGNYFHLTFELSRDTCQYPSPFDAVRLFAHANKNLIEWAEPCLIFRPRKRLIP